MGRHVSVFMENKSLTHTTLFSIAWNPSFPHTPAYKQERVGLLTIKAKKQYGKQWNDRVYVPTGTCFIKPSRVKNKATSAQALAAHSVQFRVKSVKFCLTFAVPMFPNTAVRNAQHRMELIQI